MTNVEDYIKKNIFGKPQLKPDEKNKFWETLLRG
ncbi:DUF1694 domain-containing protein [Companilactobacillus paralimentarius]|nr:DUF1694 domain-containing protein [Companilactobacillus paralimentarius]